MRAAPSPMRWGLPNMHFDDWLAALGALHRRVACLAAETRESLRALPYAEQMGNTTAAALVAEDAFQAARAAVRTQAQLVALDHGEEGDNAAQLTALVETLDRVAAIAADARAKARPET